MLRNTSGPSWVLLALLSICMGAMGLLAASPETWEGFVATSLIAAFLVVLLWRRGDVSQHLVITFALIFRLSVVWLPPVLSDDAYRYVWDGVVQARGHNPYAYAPEDPRLAELHAEPIYMELNSAEYYSVYPPASQAIFRVGALFYDAGWEVSYYVIKGILAAMEFAAVLVLTRLVAPGLLLLYAWNPVVVLSGAGQAHGEGALVLFLSLTLLAVYRGRGAQASVWLALAGCVKLYPFVLFPFLWRRFGWRSIVAGCSATALACVPYAHPDAIGHLRESLDLYIRLFEFNAGPYYAVKQVFALVTGADWSKQIGPAFRVLFLALIPVIYIADWKFAWTFRRAAAVIVGAFFLLSTTVHPWYLLGILILVAPATAPAWHWYWLSAASLGTYLLYVGDPYWPWVVAGWTGWAVLAAYRYRVAMVDAVLRRRAREKAQIVGQWLPRGWTVLDIGAGEGFVGKELVDRGAYQVELVDVVDRNRTDLTLQQYDGLHLPYEANKVDASVLIYVLHHCAAPEDVLTEALRVSAKRVVILESTYEHSWERTPLRLLDRLANGLRSGHSLLSEDEHLNFRTHGAWLDTFERLGFRIVLEERLGGFIHHRSLFVLDASRAASNASA